MDDDNDSSGTDTTSRDPDTAPNSRNLLERFLVHLFADRFLTTNPANDPSPLQAAVFALQSTAFPTATGILSQTVSASQRASEDLVDERPVSANPAGAHMSVPHSIQYGDVVFCVEDTVYLAADPRGHVGVVDRTFGDVDSHAPRPQRDYGEEIEKHDDVSPEDFEKFMRSGIPPRGTVLVAWQTQLKTELIPESKLGLVDRAMYVGDVVKRSAKDPMSGTVIGTRAFCTLFPAALFNPPTLTPAMLEELSIRAVPAAELINTHEFVEGALVVYDDWIGRIEEVYEEAAVKLSNNSVVVVENPDDLEHEVAFNAPRLNVGDLVKTKKGNLRRGLWKYGAFDPNVRPAGMIVETRPVWMSVHWITRRIGAPPSGVQNEPPTRLYRDEFESHKFFVYDASRAATATLPISNGGKDLSYHVAELGVGDRVRFKDMTGATVKYDGTKTLPDGRPQGKVTKVPRTETLGYDMNVYLVMRTHTQVFVQWQDLSITEDDSALLIPDPNVEDDDEVWPGEVVCTKEQRNQTTSDVPWTFRPAKVGIVQAVKSRDRIATVRWFENPTIQFLGDDLIPPCETGKLCDDAEDVSLYDIRSETSLNRRRGDFVLVHPDSFDPSLLSSNTEGPYWFGEIIDLGLDGKVTVRLGAAKPVVDIRVPPERVTLAYSSDMHSPFFDMPVVDGDSDDYDDEDEESDFDSASFNEMWIEYEGMDGEPVDGSDSGEWSTEDEGDSDGDESMPDLEPAEDAATSSTTPDANSDAERKPSGATSADTNEGLAQDNASTPDAMQVDSTATPQETRIADKEAAPTDGPAGFMILDAPPPTSHHYLHQTTSSSSTFTRRIAKEHKILRSSLPPNIYVRTWESRLDLLRVLMIGPSDTPYEYAPFLIDFHLPSAYPSQPPSAFFHSWTAGEGPVNPNLYEDGKICLSLLGTWHADERNESWSPGKSTLLQVLVSIMGLVLVKEPYYNEAGYEVHREAPETKLSSALYTERTYFRARGFIVHALRDAVEPFEEELRWLYVEGGDGKPRLLEKAIATAKEILERSKEGSDEERDGLRRVSLGAAVMLRRQVEKLEALRMKEGVSA